VIEAFEKEGEAQIKKAEATVVDGIVLQGAAEVESYEIGVYENLASTAAVRAGGDLRRGLVERVSPTFPAG